VKELAEEFTKDLKDEGKVVKEFKVAVLEPMKKEGKKEPEGKKRKKQLPKNLFIHIYINQEWAEEEAINIPKKGIYLDTEYKNRHIAVDFSSPNNAKEMHVVHLFRLFLEKIFAYF
jgi:arginyl-tRNA synthetase